MTNIIFQLLFCFLLVYCFHFLWTYLQDTFLVKKRKTIHPEIEKYKLLLESKIIESEKKCDKIESNKIEIDQEQTEQALNSFLEELLSNHTDNQVE